MNGIPPDITVFGTLEIVPSQQSQGWGPQCLLKPLYPPGAQSAAWHSTHHL